MSGLIADETVDITGLICPIPLIETRRAIKRAELGQIIEFIGTSAESISRKDILLAVENLKQELLSNEDILDSDKWRILIRVQK